MGVQITELLSRQEIRLEDLGGKVIAIDAFNHLYQFLTTIRQRDGTPLLDSKGNITSHLSGLFSRSMNLLEKNIRPVYIFDGKSPSLKKEERARRDAAKLEAEVKYKIAMEKEDIDEMKKYAGRTTRLTSQIIWEAKELIGALGLPIIQAPSEGEAQASLLVKNGDAFTVSSQDSDSLLFGSPRLVRNLAAGSRRKIGNKLAYEQVRPELIDLQQNLLKLGITHDQMISLAILVGTDFNRGGIKGIGPKNALKLVKESKGDLDTLFAKVKWQEHFSIDWREIFHTFKQMPVEDDYELHWNAIDAESVARILVEKHDFSEERVTAGLDKLSNLRSKGQQKGLGDFFT